MPRSRTLRSLLTGPAPLRRVPQVVLRQLVGYYGDWRRSRDLLSILAGERTVRSPLRQRDASRTGAPTSPSR